MTTDLHSITPLVPAGRDLNEALRFYVDEMGFTITWQAGSGAGIRRGGVAMILVETDNQNWADNSSYSIAVEDLEALFEEYRQIQARVGPLEVKSWGRREFHMIVPSGVCFQFYQG